VPVLRDECCKYLSIKKDGIYVDCTLGGGGHTRAILEMGGKVIGLDQDPDAIAAASSALKEYIDSNRLEIIKTNFRYIVDAVKTSSFLNGNGIKPSDDGCLVDGVLMDLGISSHQIDEATRGFSFSRDGPLDMRMIGTVGRGDGRETTAATIVNDWDSTDLANVLYDYGEETRSRQIAREIVASRPLNTTGELEKVISRITSWKHRPKTLARCFQALRIAVNDEIGALEDALATIHQCMKPGAPLVVISYHSLEDRRVKALFKGMADFSQSSSSSPSQWLPLFKRAQLPTEEEIERNRRSRSAKVRVALNGAGLEFDATSEILTKYREATGTSSKRVKENVRRVGKKQLAKMNGSRGEEEEDDDEDDTDEDEDDAPKRDHRDVSEGKDAAEECKEIKRSRKSLFTRK